MRSIIFQLLAAYTVFTSSDRGYFWHLTDLHLDPNYTVTTDPAKVCPSAGDQPVTDAGKWGNYLCDSPGSLINSSIYAMKTILPDPDFILWTGDDTPHVPNEKLGENSVLEIVEWLTTLIQQVFPATKVYAAFGNHDFHPKNQLPTENNSIYYGVSKLWRTWLKQESIPTFEKGAFYSEQLESIGNVGRIVVLNTNLYYDSNDITANMEDPGDQFAWLESQLSSAFQKGEKTSAPTACKKYFVDGSIILKSTNNLVIQYHGFHGFLHQSLFICLQRCHVPSGMCQGIGKVYIVGHVPPGYFEKKRGKPWFREKFNKRYIEIIQKHHQVIQGQFFGHHHTDSFRMFYSNSGNPIGSMFIAPGVSPWKTTLPGVNNGANNPGIRVFEYDRKSLNVLDMVTYYLNLTFANLESPRWEKEYRLTEAFLVPDGSPQSMHKVLEKISTNHCFLQKYYEYNSVSYDLETCGESCKIDHVCAIREVDFTKYNECVKNESSCSKPHVTMLMVMLTCLFLN